MNSLPRHHAMRYIIRMGYIDLTLKLPADLARDAEASGLLSSAKLEQMLRAEIKRKAASELVPGKTKGGDQPMPMGKIQQMVNEVRRERRAKLA